jgi:hypothetical protein
MSCPLIVSFYTRDTIYEKEVEDLILSCRGLNLEAHIEPRADLGSWEKNCCQKPEFILECLNRFKRPILWVDADAMILQRPSLSYDGFDLAIHFNDFEKRIVRSGTIYAAPTAAAKRLMSRWHRACLQTFDRLKDLPYGDQGQLPKLLLSAKSLKVAKLPVEYVQIFDRDPIPIERAVILHSQASRTARMHPAIWKRLTGRDLKKMRISSIAARSFREE